MYKKINEKKNKAIAEIMSICLEVSNQENIFCTSQSALDYILAMEQLLKEYQYGRISDTSLEDVKRLGKEYWDCASTT